jgi:hypothetical protein
MPIIPDSRITKIVNSKYERDSYINRNLSINSDYVDESSTNDEDYSSICKIVFRTEDSTSDEHLSKSIISNNLNLVSKLESYGLLLNDNHICDCGIGLGEALFDIYKQTTNIQNKTFHFYGVEKNKELIDLFNKNLLKFWPKIEIIQDDIMNHDFSKYNIVYTYTPTKDIKQLEKIYQKIADELPTFGILIENLDKGLGFQNCLIDLLENHPRIEVVDVDGFVIYQKV